MVPSHDFQHPRHEPSGTPSPHLTKSASLKVASANFENCRYKLQGYCNKFQDATYFASLKVQRSMKTSTNLANITSRTSLLMIDLKTPMLMLFPRALC
jgi:hypothetical protein